jgi:hypothetical protein
MRRISVAVFLVSAMLCAPLVTAQSTDSAWTQGGLQRITVKGLDAAFAKPGASLAQYDKVLLRPVEVAFQKNWARNMSTGTRMRVSSEDMQRIRSRLATRLQDAVRSELAAGGYKLVDAPGDDVLDVQMDIVNLYVPAPAVHPGMHQPDVYAVSAGQATLVVQLNDSVTGDAIARAVQNYAAAEGVRMTRIDNFENDVEAGKACAIWAKSLRDALDRSRASAD